jgi:hypothetical protein
MRISVPPGAAHSDAGQPKSNAPVSPERNENRRKKRTRFVTMINAMQMD